MIIGVSGLKGSGKDTAANLLCSRFYDIHKEAFADPMKRFCQEIFGFSDDQLWGPSSSRERADVRYRRADGHALTPRYALQRLGTEWGRDCCPDLWVRYAMRKAFDRTQQGFTTVITDVRFVNEAQAIRDQGGTVWRIERFDIRNGNLPDKHQSESEQYSPEFERLISTRIDNRDDLQALEARVLAAGMNLGLQLKDMPSWPAALPTPSY